MSAACATPYLRREPEATVLFDVVRSHLNTFLATHKVPGHVRRALRKYLDSAHGRSLHLLDFSCSCFLLQIAPHPAHRPAHRRSTCSTRRIFCGTSYPATGTTRVPPTFSK